MGIRVLSLLAAALLTAHAGECWQIGPEGRVFGKVEVVAVDYAGVSMEAPQIDIIDRRTGERVARATRGIFEKVSYGEYLLRVSSPGFRASEEILRVAQSETVVRVPLTLAVTCSTPQGVYGAIRLSLAERDLWVKLVPVRGSGGYEARAPFGYFALPYVNVGDYFLFVVEGDKILHSRTVKVAPLGGDTKLQIEVKAP